MTSDVPPHNAFKSAEDCARWLDSISHIEGSFALSNAAEWIRHLAKQAALPPEGWQPLLERQKAREHALALYGNLCLSSLEGQEASDDCATLIAAFGLAAPSSAPSQSIEAKPGVTVRHDDDTYIPKRIRWPK